MFTEHNFEADGFFLNLKYFQNMGGIIKEQSNIIIISNKNHIHLSYKFKICIIFFWIFIFL